MGSLFSKILLSLVISVVIALLVVVLMTRTSLHRGMVDYIEQQEAGQLEKLAPELSELYRQQGDWSALRGHPRRWNGLLRLTRPTMPIGAEGLEDRHHAPFSADSRRPRPNDRLNLRRRLFLLDSQKARVAGVVVSVDKEYHMEPIDVAGEVVGWLGFVPARVGLPWEAQRFLHQQARVLILSLAIALALVAVLGFLLARHLSRPVRDLANVVEALAQGEYSARAVIRTGDEIGSLCTDVNLLAATLEKNQTARRRWMADIAHELRTPVTILKGEVEALEDGVRAVNQQTSASLSEEVEHLAHLVDDLQTLALSDAGALNLQKEPVDFSVFLQHSAEAFRTRLAEKGIELCLAVPEGVTINADPQRLKQLLHNLFENCSRYVEKDGVVRLSLSTNEETAVLNLDDSGPGLETEQMASLFERFYRAEGSRARSSGGSGLGLAICRNIVETHQGSIRAERSRLGGLCIHVELPTHEKT